MTGAPELCAIAPYRQRSPFIGLNLIAEEFAHLCVIICLRQALLVIYMTILGAI